MATNYRGLLPYLPIYIYICMCVCVVNNHALIEFTHFISYFLDCIGNIGVIVTFLCTQNLMCNGCEYNCDIRE